MIDETSGLVQILSEALDYSSIPTNQVQYLKDHGVSLDKSFVDMPFKIKAQIDTLENLLTRLSTSEEKHSQEVDCLILETKVLINKFKSCWKK